MLLRHQHILADQQLRVLLAVLCPMVIQVDQGILVPVAEYKYYIRNRNKTKKKRQV